jgi:vacuolar protein sorting-associated protein 26
MASFFFSAPVDIDIVLEDADEREAVDIKLDKNRREKAPLYLDEESIKGAVTIRPKDGKRLEHTGIKVQFIGVIGELLQLVLGSLPRPRRRDGNL